MVDFCCSYFRILFRTLSDNGLLKNKHTDGYVFIRSKSLGELELDIIIILH